MVIAATNQMVEPSYAGQAQQVDLQLGSLRFLIMVRKHGSGWSASVTQLTPAGKFFDVPTMTQVYTAANACLEGTIQQVTDLVSVALDLPPTAGRSATLS